MKADLEVLNKKFAEFNKLIFGGHLPEVRIELCEVSSFVGQYKSKIRMLPDGRREHYDHLLRFSTRFELSEKALEDTLIHEMIHYFIAYNGLGDRTAHGPLFKALMVSINETHGRSIGISHRTTRSEMVEASTAKKKWHVIAILEFSSGETGVKVLPRVIPKIIEYHDRIKSSPNISDINLYFHCDPYFNRFPTSTGRRCHAITDEEIKVHLKGAHILKVKGNKLIQK